jgi:hypothetical protein
MGEGEIGKIYFGDWLRDYSQLGVGRDSPFKFTALMTILNILSMGGFNRPLDPDKLGGCMPSEHMDNPLGGKTGEDKLASPKHKEESTSKLSPEQRAALSEEESAYYKAQIEEAHRRTGVPDYIERGKRHAKQKLEEAIRDGETTTACSPWRRSS